MQPAAPPPSPPPDLPKPPGTRDNGATADGRLGKAAGRAHHVPEPEEGSHPMAQTNHPSVPAQPLAAEPADTADSGFRPRLVAPPEPELPDLSAAGEEFGDELPPDRFLDRERSWLAFNERV